MALRADPSNEQPAKAWDGDDGALWAAHADRFDKSNAGYHAPLMAAAAIGAEDRVLDVGCGCGQVTLDAARAASKGSALGVDLSAAMLDVARDRATAAGISNAQFEHADAQIHPFPDAGFDVIVSRQGTMFFGDRDAAFANLARSLRPGGRLAMVVWQRPENSEWMRELFAAIAVGRDLSPPPVGSLGPFALAEPDEINRLLSSAGFTDVQIEEVAAPVWWGDDADDAQHFILTFFSWLVRDLDDELAARAKANLHASLTAHTTPDGVTYSSTAWLVRAQRP